MYIDLFTAGLLDHHLDLAWCSTTHIEGITIHLGIPITVLIRTITDGVMPKSVKYIDIIKYDMRELRYTEMISG